MTGKCVLKDRKISSKRVHIERIIGLAKTFKILKEPLNVAETKLATEITFDNSAGQIWIVSNTFKL